MFINSLKLCLLVLFLNGCASQPKEEIQYYLLNQQTELINKRQHTHTINLSKIHLAKIRLPEYLTQPYLVMQLNEHQLHYARFHLWAESLQTGIAKALQSDLNLSDSPFLFNINNTHSNPQNSLVLEINHFYPTNSSKVILSGKFWLLDNNGQVLIAETSFKFEADLNQNGYQNAVSEMRKLISNLSRFLIDNLTSQANNIF